MVYKDKVKEEYGEYLDAKGSRWEFANSILYDMCKTYPNHVNLHEIVAKIWLIGRSYSAAIERTKEKDESKDFYYEVAAPIILIEGASLDRRINDLKTPLDNNSIGKVLDTHGFLTSVFKKITKMNKRSLASKYLHFHCPNMFFIYDSKASAAMKKLVKREGKVVDKYALGERDQEYIDFCVRAIELRDFINSEFKVALTPRDLDDFLLFYNDKN